MADKKKKTGGKSAKQAVAKIAEISYFPGFQDVRSEEELQERVSQYMALDEALAPLLAHQVEMKKCITEYGVRKKRIVIQMPGYYFRQITRNTKMWVGEKSQMPNPKPKGAKSVREICGDKTVKVNGKRKKLWNLVTKRVVDPQLIDVAVNKGWITEDEIDKAYVEAPGKPFYQRYEGEASD